MHWYRIVVVKYLGPTTYRGARFRCQMAGYPRKIYPRHYEADVRIDVVEIAKRYVAEVVRSRFRVLGLANLPGGEWGVIVQLL